MAEDRRRHWREQIRLMHFPRRGNRTWAHRTIGRNLSPRYRRRNDRIFWRDHYLFNRAHPDGRARIMRQYVTFRDERFRNQALGRWVAGDKGLPKKIFDEYM